MHTNGYARARSSSSNCSRRSLRLWSSPPRAHRCTDLLAAFGFRAAQRVDDDPDDEARVLDALAASPSDPDTLALRLGLSTTALAAIVARLMSRGRIGVAGDGRLARN